MRGHQLLAGQLVAILALAAAAAAESTDATTDNGRAGAIVPVVAIDVIASPTLPRAVSAAMTAEANRIWRPSGITFDWQFVPEARLSHLAVAVVDDVGRARAGELSLGWTDLDGDGRPAGRIHLSKANALRLAASLHPSEPIVYWPTAEVNALIARALGRALAHELGHVLFASAAHTRRGLMQTDRPVWQFFSPDVKAFEITAAEAMHARIFAGRSLPHV